MIVKKENFRSVIKLLSEPAVRAADTETTGLKWYDKDHLFSIIVANDATSFYFNFNERPDHLGNRAPDDSILPREWLKEFLPVFDNKKSLWFMHNAKFDLAMLAKDGLHVTGSVHCTEAVARLLNNKFQKYNLASCVERMAEELKIPNIAKDDAVMDYIKKHKLSTQVKVEGKEKPIEELHFDLVPFEIIAPYGETDGGITQKLGRYQVQKVETRSPEFKALVENERRLTKTALKMAQVGVPYDEAKVRSAMANEIARITQAENEYKAHTGKDFVDSGVQFAEFFESQGIEYKRTDKDNPRFDEYALDTMPTHPVVDLIKAHRSANKKVSTYYSSFLYYGANGRIHADMRQAGTTTGRVSYREPNMQNVPKPDEDDAANTDSVEVRGCFVPPPGQCLFMPDYDQMEYRMMLDAAEQKDVIKKILEEGLDVHDATAQLMGVKRKAAKTLNFLLLYGGGNQKLANALGIPLSEAADLKKLYFAKLPFVQRWINRTISGARINGYIKNWAGRICYVDKDFAYKAPNYFIQGGCADVMKFAMNQIDELISNKDTKMSLQIHDELMFFMPPNEFELAPKIVQIMESVYKCKHLPLTAGAAHSWSNWGVKTEGFPV
jgi:DNA polymerase-1